jgi:hypothetical protein
MKTSIEVTHFTHAIKILMKFHHKKKCFMLSDDQNQVPLWVQETAGKFLSGSDEN